MLGSIFPPLPPMCLDDLQTAWDRDYIFNRGTNNHSENSCPVLIEISDTSRLHISSCNQFSVLCMEWHLY